MVREKNKHLQGSNSVGFKVFSFVVYSTFGASCCSSACRGLWLKLEFYKRFSSFCWPLPSLPSRLYPCPQSAPTEWLKVAVPTLWFPAHLAQSLELLSASFMQLLMPSPYPCIRSVSANRSTTFFWPWALKFLTMDKMIFALSDLLLLSFLPLSSPSEWNEKQK